MSGGRFWAIIWVNSQDLWYYILFFRIIMRAGGTNVMLVTLLIPISAVALGVALLGEAVSPADLGGMALISAALMIIDGRVLRGLRRAPAN